MKFNRILTGISFFLLFFFSQLAWAAGDPVSVLKTVADEMIADLKSHQVTLKSDRQYVFSLAYRLVVPRVDVDEMARRVLPPQTWSQANPEQKAAFKRQFVALMVHTYASALASYKDQTVEFFPIRGGYEGKTTVEVNSQIISESGAPPISVRYRLINTSGAWKLYDMSVEGISVLESFRSQFADLLSQGDITALTNRLAAHNGRSGD